jgi:glucokinase
MNQKNWTIGVDLGGTKVEAAAVDASGSILKKIRRPTAVAGGPEAVAREIVEMVSDLQGAGPGQALLGVGVGVAGQIEATTGVVRFAPNLKWRDVPFREQLGQILKLPVALTNDVRAATWGEWLHGAGQGCDDLICLFVGTGIGGGVVSGGRMLSGCSNTAGELGHTTVALDGPVCTCGRRGCLEALAGGWAIARQARNAIQADPAGGRGILQAAAELKQRSATPEDVTAQAVARAAQSGDPLAGRLVEEAARALVAGCASLVNAFNPCRLILGGGVIEGLPELVERIARGVAQEGLQAATESLQVLPARLHGEAGVIGAAALARLTVSGEP